MIFADSSALVKRYVDEAGSDVVRGLAGLVASAIARVEVPAAIWAKSRRGHITPHAAERVTRSFELDLHGAGGEAPGLPVIDVDTRLLRDAADLTATHALRAYDAVQLASALAARDADPACERFACFDDVLRAAAARSGFALVP